jgi:hypothetical protein
MVLVARKDLPIVEEPKEPFNNMRQYRSDKLQLINGGLKPLWESNISLNCSRRKALFSRSKRV